MALKTLRTYVGDGTTTIYSIDFTLGYINRDYVHVYLDGDDYTTELTYTWLNDSQIELSSPVPSTVSFHIRRVVPSDVLVNDYEDGAILREENLDDSFKQALMALEEVVDDTLSRTGDEPNYMETILDMNSNRIINLGIPIDANDAVRLYDLQIASVPIPLQNIVHIDDYIQKGFSPTVALETACNQGVIVVFTGSTITLDSDFIYPATGICREWLLGDGRINLVDNAQIRLGNVQNDFRITGTGAIIDGGLKRAKLTSDFVADGTNQTFQVEAGHGFVAGETVASSWNNNYLTNSTSRLGGSFPLTALPEVLSTTDTTVVVKFTGAVNETIPAGNPVPLQGAELFNARFDKVTLSFTGSGSFYIEGVTFQNCPNAYALNLYDSANETLNAFVTDVTIDSIALDAMKFRGDKLFTKNLVMNDIVDIGKQCLVWANETKTGSWNSSQDTFTPNNNDALLYINPDNGTTGYCPDLHLESMYVDGINNRDFTLNTIFAIDLAYFLSMRAATISTLVAGTVYMEDCEFKRIDRNIIGSTFAPVDNVSYGDMQFANCKTDAEWFYEVSSNITQAPKVTVTGGYCRVNQYSNVVGANYVSYRNTLITENFPINAEDFYVESTATTTRSYKRGDYVTRTDSGSKYECVSTSAVAGDLLTDTKFLQPSTRLARGVYGDNTVLFGDLDLRNAEIVLENVVLPKREGLTKPRFFTDYISPIKLILQGYDNTSPTEPDLLDWITETTGDTPPFDFMFESTTLEGTFGGREVSTQQIHLKLINARIDSDIGKTAPYSTVGAFSYKPPIGTVVTGTKDRQVSEVLGTATFTVTSAGTTGDTTITGTSANQIAEGSWIGVNVAGESNVNYYTITDVSLAPVYGILNALSVDTPTNANCAVITHRRLTKGYKSLFKSGGGTLSVSEVNVLTDSGTYTLPAADTIGLNEYIQIHIPDLYKAQVPVVQRYDVDEITYSGGSDISITFDSGKSVSLTLTSNGVDEWRL